MPNVPQFKKYPPIADPVTAEVLRQFFKEDDDWTQFVATIINSGLLTRQLATNVAVPATATAFAPQPAMVTPPSWKSTVPVLVPDAGAVAVTVAV